MGIYQNAVVEVGSEASVFLEEGMLVTFGKEAPPELRDFCFLVDAEQKATAVITPGKILRLDDVAFTITAVGGVAQANLDNLGHVTINSDGAESAAMAGTIHVAGVNPLPVLKVGSTIIIE